MELTKILRRRWATTIAMIVLSLIVIGAADKALPSTYQAKSNVLLLPSKNLAKTYGGNPYLAFNSTLNETADVVRYEVTDVGSAQALAAQGYTQGYTITDVFDTAAPVLQITVTGGNKAAVENTLSGVTHEVQVKLTQQQTGLPSYDTIGSTVISYATTPSAVSSKKLRSLLIVAAVCLLLLFAVPVIIDTVALRRRNRRGGRTVSTDMPMSRQDPVGGNQDRDTYEIHEGEFADYPNGDYRDAPRRDRDRDEPQRGGSQHFSTDRDRSPGEMTAPGDQWRRR